MVAGFAHPFFTLVLIAALILTLFAFQTHAVLAQGAPITWLIERVDVGQLSKTDIRSLQAPSLVIDSNQQPHLVYSEFFEEGPPSRLNYATRTAQGWITRTADLDGGASPSLALTRQNQLRVSYLDIFVATNSAKYGQSSDGVVWASQPVTAGFNSLRSSSDLALDANDQASIAVGSQESISNRIYRMTLAVQVSDTWAIQPIADGNGIAPTLAVDSLGQTHVSYLSARGAGRWVVSYAVLANGLWLTETVGDIDTTPVVVSSHIAVDAGNTPHIAYTNRTRNELVYASRTNGAWTRQIITGSVDALDMVLDEAGLPHLAYIEPTTPHRLVYAFQSSPGGTWISSTVTAGVKDDPLPPLSIALGPTGLPYIAYIDFTTGDVRVARLGQAVYVPVVIH